MIIIDLSPTRKLFENTIKDLYFNISLNEHKIKKGKIIALGSLAAVFSINNTALAESFKITPGFIDNHLCANLFALCEILKQTNYPQLALAIEQTKNIKHIIK